MQRGVVSTRDGCAGMYYTEGAHRLTEFHGLDILVVTSGLSRWRGRNNVLHIPHGTSALLPYATASARRPFSVCGFPVYGATEYLPSL